MGETLQHLSRWLPAKAAGSRLLGLGISSMRGMHFNAGRNACGSRFDHPLGRRNFPIFRLAAVFCPSNLLPVPEISQAGRKGFAVIRSRDTTKLHC
jgi:hypothetical protein